jgi:hypothetical protein
MPTSSGVCHWPLAALLLPLVLSALLTAHAARHISPVQDPEHASRAFSRKLLQYSSLYWGPICQGDEFRKTYAVPRQGTFSICSAAAGGVSFNVTNSIATYLGVNSTLLPPPGKAGKVNLPGLEAALRSAGVDPETNLVLQPMEFLENYAQAGLAIEDSSMRPLPQLIHIALKSKNAFSLRNVLCITSWLKMNPTAKLLIFDNDEQAQYVQTYTPENWEVFRSLPRPVSKSDFWRYAVLCKHGGVYTGAERHRLGGSSLCHAVKQAMVISPRSQCKQALNIVQYQVAYYTTS